MLRSMISVKRQPARSSFDCGHSWSFGENRHPFFYSWFTVLHLLLLFNTVIQSYICAYIYFFIMFSVMVYHKMLHIVFCAMW